MGKNLQYKKIASNKQALMWKAIFIESCLLSVLIFGGFYVHSKIIKEEIDVSEDSIKIMSARQKLAHISGNNSLTSDSSKDHLSGNRTKKPLGHISGIFQKSPSSNP